MAHLILLLFIVVNFLPVHQFLLFLLLFQKHDLLDPFRGELLINHFLLGWKAFFLNLLLSALDLQIAFLFLFLIILFVVITFFNDHFAF